MIRFEKTLKCFQSSSDCLYGRKEEVEAIKRFAEAKDQILHITGNPGTGKTHTVLWTLKSLAAMQNSIKIDGAEKEMQKNVGSTNSKSSFKYIYLNYFTEKNINCKFREHISEHRRQISGSKKKSCINSKQPQPILVIDEFDKYYEESRKECLKNIHMFKNNGFKIITISNDLRMGNIRFTPYSAFDIVEILQEKMEKEIGGQVIEHIALVYLVKKYGNGDLRAVMKKITEIFLNAGALEDNYRIRLADVVETQGKQIGKGVHHEIIFKIKENEMNEKIAYQKYLQECSVFSLMVLERQDFEIIFDFL